MYSCDEPMMLATWLNFRTGNKKVSFWVRFSLTRVLKIIICLKFVCLIFGYNFRNGKKIKENLYEHQLRG